MGEENKKKNMSTSSTSRTMESLSLEINRYPRDLLQSFMSSSETQQFKSEEEEEKEEIELNLGLSLGGRFGVDKSTKKLTRSSSIAGSIPLIRDNDTFTSQPVSYPGLMRTSSLPTETEEEWRKRKELQCLRRMEAKRRRSEKQKNLRGGIAAAAAGGEGNLEEENKDLNVNRVNWRPMNLKRVGSGASNTLLGFIGQQQQQQQASQGSVESQGGSSSGMSEMESKNVQGSSSIGETRSPGSNQSLQERNNQDVGGSSGTKTKDNPIRTARSDAENLSKKLDSAESRGKEIGTNAMEEMPCVFTKGDGPNGRRVDGILYKYGKGEEVRIMCVCHGNFLSPAEFVKHAGGGDVDNPLRHIVVNPPGSSFC